MAIASTSVRRSHPVTALDFWASASSDAPLEFLIAHLVWQAREKLGFDHCVVVLDGMPTADALDGRIVAASLATQAWWAGRTVTVALAGELDCEELAQDLLDRGYRSLLLAPLCDGDIRFGAMIGYCVDQHTFDCHQMRSAELMAGHAATAIRSAMVRVAHEATIVELSAANNELLQIQNRLHWADQQERLMMDTVLCGAGLGGLIDVLAQALQATTVLRDNAGRVLATAGRSECLYSTNTNVELGECAKLPVATMPVMIGSESLGRVEVVGDSVCVDVGGHRALERLAFLVGVELVKERQIREAESRVSGDLMVDLLRADGCVRPDVLIARAALLGHDLTEPQYLATLTVDRPMESATAIGLVDEIVSAQEALVGWDGSAVVIVLPADRDPMAVMRKVKQRVDKMSSLGNATLVLTPKLDRIEDCAAYCQAAGRAARLRNLAGGSGIVDLRDLSLTSLLLMSSIMPAQLQSFAERLIAPLVEQDERRRAGLVDTARAWLASGCSTVETANLLVVHVNTIGYRIGKIEQLLGVELRNPQSRLELQLALTVWDILRSCDITRDA